MDFNGNGKKFVADEETLLEMKGYIKENLWIIPIAEDFPEGDDWSKGDNISDVVENFLREYWLLDNNEITPPLVVDFLWAIKNTISEMKTNKEL